MLFESPTPLAPKISCLQIPTPPQFVSVPRLGQGAEKGVRPLISLSLGPSKEEPGANPIPSLHPLTRAIPSGSHPIHTWTLTAWLPGRVQSNLTEVPTSHAHPSINLLFHLPVRSGEHTHKHTALHQKVRNICGSLFFVPTVPPVRPLLYLPSVCDRSPGSP